MESKYQLDFRKRKMYSHKTAIASNRKTTESKIEEAQSGYSIQNMTIRENFIKIAEKLVQDKLQNIDLSSIVL